MKNRYNILGFIILLAIFLLGTVATTIDDFFMPGSQPGESGSFDTPNQCASCHGGYDNEVEPMFTWQGSMMAQAMRDPLYLASLAIANQDAVDAGDLCIRCHSPAGWLSGRSEPTDGSALTADDREGVQCHFCHKLIDPASTADIDLAYLNTLSAIPPQSGNGMFVADSDDRSKRGPFNDANAKHPVIYSTFHSESDICATCHDVSNPAFTKAADGTYQPNNFGAPSPTFDTYEMFPVERTYSEWKMSAYNTPAGIYSDAFGGNKANVSTCQDCHMKDVTGYGCNKNGVPLRNDLPLHDMTGGNTFVPQLVAQLFPNEINLAAINAGIMRAEGMLKNAATMNLTAIPDGNGFKASVEIVNETGHKLPSGYPEGRRMWINLSAYDINGNLLFESGVYNAQTAVLNMSGAKIYEAKLGMSEAVAAAASADGIKTYVPGESFHFALNNTVVKDNRIPPRGFTNANFAAIQAAPVGYSYPDGAFFDITEYEVPSNTYRVNAKLLYQTASKEYIEFLRDENRTNNAGQVLYDQWEANGRSAPVIMEEADFYTDVLDVSEYEQLLAQQIKIYPNPATDLVHIDIKLDNTTFSAIEIYNMTGAKIETLHQGFMHAGDHKIEWNTKNISKGIYIMKFNYFNKAVSKMIFIK